ncbi:hypothetical protein EHS39_22975 [Ensifer sp. MPMI2T]|nr:hypothetical protein EHS39_22975 [Ensifer sp. MPMI2T]
MNDEFADLANWNDEELRAACLVAVALLGITDLVERRPRWKQIYTEARSRGWSPLPRANILGLD